MITANHLELFRMASVVIIIITLCVCWTVLSVANKKYRRKDGNGVKNIRE